MENLSIGYVVLAFALAVGGGALGASLGRSHRRLCALISLGAGTLLGVTVFAILPETISSLHWWGLLPALGSGYAVFFLITKYVYHVCPACAASHFDEATTHRFNEIATAMMVALAIHCTADGVALAAGHEAHASHIAGGRVLDFSLVMAVCVHKIPEGLALGALLLGAGSAARGWCGTWRRWSPPPSSGASWACLSCGTFPISGWRSRLRTRAADFCFSPRTPCWVKS